QKRSFIIMYNRFSQKLLIAIIAPFATTTAQKFRCLVSDSPRYYEEISTSNVRQLMACHVVSIMVEDTDTVLYLQHGPKALAIGVDCNGDSATNIQDQYVNIYGHGWLGEKMVITETGWNLF